ERIGQTYREKSKAVIEAFKANGVRVIQGSPGCVGKLPGCVKGANGSVDDLNLNLCNLRNIGIELAGEENVGFADVFRAMLTAGIEAQKKYATNYAIAGTDGIHPNWAGQTIMAYAFLKAFGLDGQLGTFTVDLMQNKMTTSKGHEVISGNDGAFQIKSSKYPFCGCEPSGQVAAAYPACDSDNLEKDNSIRSAMTLVPFSAELNRFMLVATGKAQKYQVSWGTQSKSFSADQLKRGI